MVATKCRRRRRRTTSHLLSLFRHRHRHACIVIEVQSAGSEARWPDRLYVSKLKEFVCPSSTPLSTGSERCSTARQIVSKLTDFVCPSSADCFKTNRIRLSVINPSAVRWLGTVLDGQTDCFKTNRIRLSVINPSTVRWLDMVRRSTARQISQKGQNSSVRRRPVQEIVNRNRLGNRNRLVDRREVIGNRNRPPSIFIWQKEISNRKTYYYHYRCEPLKIERWLRIQKFYHHNTFNCYCGQFPCV